MIFDFLKLSNKMGYLRKSISETQLCCLQPYGCKMNTFNLKNHERKLFQEWNRIYRGVEE